jgi:DNA polymerase elongation subunit (family B)
MSSKVDVTSHSGSRFPVPRSPFEGWLFDVYPVSEGMVVWLIDSDGRAQRLLYPYRPAMYVSGSPGALGHAEQAIRQARLSAELTPAIQREFMAGEEIPVVRVALRSPLQYPVAARTLARVPGLTLYNCDIAIPRLFFYDTGLFPLAWCEVEHEAGVIRALQALSAPEDLEYPLPPLVTMQLRLDTGGAAPAHGSRGLLEVSLEGETAVLDGARPEDLITSLNRMLQRYDPDVLLTEWGDSFLLPQLRALAAGARQPLLLNRDRGQGVRTRRDRSYTTYGQVVFQAGAQMLHGRWHLDFRNSFIYGESELAGLLDIARLARIPVQELGRTSTGTAISSMQLNQAIRDGILIPWQKSEPEAFKTASQLLLTDKGGLTYQPIVGLFEQVGELDFSSMYPMIMSKFNISPETVECSCCPDSRVPEIGYTVCRRRHGLVPKVLEHLLDRRIYYKQRKQETEGDARAMYDQRQTALKWCLVTCLAGDTLILHRSTDRWKIAPIQQIVDAYLPGEQWGVLPANDLAVSGVDSDLQNCTKQVAQVMKTPAPSTMIDVKLQWGRRLRMIASHQCYVLKEGRLTTCRADQLLPGDWVPVSVTLDDLIDRPIAQVDCIEGLKHSLTIDEQKVWRVFGAPVRRLVRRRYAAIGRRARGEYTDKTIWNWSDGGYLPLEYVEATDFAPSERNEVSLGRGKRTGGLIQRLPAILSIDEDMGFLLGFFVGDGSINGNMIRFAVGGDEEDHLQRLGGIIHRKFGLKSHTYRERKAQMYILQVNSVALIQILEHVFRIGRTARTGKLHIPDVILHGSKEAKRGFILGLVASDGHIGPGRSFAGISSADRGFIHEVSWLLTLIGVDHRLAHAGHLYSVQTKNSEETAKLLRGTALASAKHLRRWADRQSRIQLLRAPQFPSVASGLMEICREARVARVPRVSRVGVVSKAVARVKLEQIRKRRSRLAPETEAKLPQLGALIESSLIFARVLSVDQVPSNQRFVYCFRLSDEPAAFFVEGGILTRNSFGYLGYRNARFGRIEAHESVTAYSREMLLRAKEIAEDQGYRMLHALVDSMWLHKPGAGRDQYEALARDVTAATNLPIYVEGVYQWIGFLPSRTHSGVGVPNRYMGLFEDGKTKVRGIEVRRSDVPIIVERMQTELLQVMFGCKTLAEVHAAMPELLGIVEDALVRLRAGEVTAAELAVTNRLSQEPSEYTHNSAQAIAARTLAWHGARLHPGEAVQYIITNRKAKLPEDRVRPYTLLGTDWNYDAEVYADFLLRAAETVLELFGYSRARLRDEVTPAS